MKIEETKELMISKDYKDRFLAEYWQLKNRYYKLNRLIMGMKKAKSLNKPYSDILGFTPKCSFYSLKSQLYYMRKYLNLLEKRANIEDISLNDNETNVRREFSN